MGKHAFEDRSELGPICPTCKEKLIVRTNRTNESQFLGCPNYPDCLYTEKIPYEFYARAAGQTSLFELE